MNDALKNPGSIAVVGASKNLQKPGGKLVQNLVVGGYKGDIFPVNPHENEIFGSKCYHSIEELPQIDLAVLVISPEDTVRSVEYLAQHKKTKAFIIISAGFSEIGNKGAHLQNKLKKQVLKNKLNIIGPNCIGVINSNYRAVFVSMPEVYKQGVDFVTASGAFAVFTFESAAKHGLKFNTVYSVGNSVDIGVEEVLADWDMDFKPAISSRVKLVYVEQIRKPELFYTCVRSLREKGCHVLIIKPGDSKAGARAALSHTGAITSGEDAFTLLIKKAGAIQCYGREEFINLACVLQHKQLFGRNIAVVTHAGGPAVMLSDSLEKQGFNLPEFKSDTQTKLSERLHFGASVHNPVDILATANSEQLNYAISTCDKLSYIDGIVVIYGKTGMEDLFQTYYSLSQTINICDKPVYVVIPSINSASEEIDSFTKQGKLVFFDEVELAFALGKFLHEPEIFSNELYIPEEISSNNLKTRILNENEVIERLKWSGLPNLESILITEAEDLKKIETEMFPVVLKVTGILHKTDVGGVITHINNPEELEKTFVELMLIKGASGGVVQSMIKGTELFLGAKMHPGIGYSVHAGLGGIFVELIEDIASSLAPVDYNEALRMICSIKANKIFEDFRGDNGIDSESFASLVVVFSRIFELYPDIVEMDVNPLIGIGKSIVAVDTRIIVKED